MNNAPMTAEQFNAKVGVGSFTFTGINPQPQVVFETGLNRECSIHKIPMNNIQHPMKPLGVIMAQYCPECLKDLQQYNQQIREGNNG